MFNMNLNKLNVNEAELKAFIYQQLNEIQPFVGDCDVGIKMIYTPDNQFLVRMQASHEGGDVEVEGTNEDVYSALSQAKHALIRTFSSLDQNESEDEESESSRDNEIQTALSKKEMKH
jgi:ribosome-associated translation inhibitor RaiA